MNKLLMLALFLMVVSVGCIVEDGKIHSDENGTTQNLLRLYDSFLNGEICANLDGNGEESSEINIEELFLRDEKCNKYTIFDSNRNGIPELHLSSMREYLILEPNREKLSIIYDGSGYEKLLNSGALLYLRPGGGPEHISYKYTELDADHNITQSSFEKYNTMNDNDGDDLYVFEGKRVTRNEYDTKTKKFLSEGSDLIIWSDYGAFFSSGGLCRQPTMVKNHVLITHINDAIVSDLIYGNWEIVGYLGRAVDSQGSRAITDDQKNNIERATDECKKKYLNKELFISSMSLIDYSPPTELGYRVLTLKDLFLIYRQPPDIWSGISPPFVCISISLEDYDNTMDLLVDSDGIVTLVVEGEFFRLEKVESQQLILNEDKDKLVSNIYDYLEGEWIFSEFINLAWYPTSEENDEQLRADYEKEHKEYLGKQIRFNEDNLMLSADSESLTVYTAEDKYSYRFSVYALLEPTIIEVFGKYKDEENKKEGIRLIFSGNGDLYIEYRNFFFKLVKVR